MVSAIEGRVGVVGAVSVGRAIGVERWDLDAVVDGVRVIRDVSSKP